MNCIIYIIQTDDYNFTSGDYNFFEFRALYHLEDTLR